MAITQGLWNIAGINIPDVGFNEGLKKLTGIQIGPLNSNQYPSQGALGVNTTAPLNGSGSSVPTYVNNVYGPANPSTGLVGGSNTVPNAQGNPQQSSGGGDSQLAQLQKAAASGGLNPTQQAQLNALQAAQDPYAGLRSQISSGWDNYLGSLNDTAGFFDQQKTAQQGIAQSQYDQGVSQVNDQRAKSLRDIANTTRNAFQAGNNYLGSLGAGDSSAANQYAFAINQQANKQTGDLNNYVNSQLQGLKSTYDQQQNQIASWFAQQQANLKQQIAQGQLSKSQDIANLSKNILDQAIQATNEARANAQNQYNALLSWASNNATSIGQLTNNISQIPQAMGQFNLLGGAGGGTPLYGGAPSASTKTDIFGNPILA